MIGTDREVRIKHLAIETEQLSVRSTRGELARRLSAQFVEFRLQISLRPSLFVSVSLFFPFGSSSREAYNAAWPACLSLSITVEWNVFVTG
jgi:hypothetical protein